MYIKLKTDIGNISKGSIVEVLKGDGYFYIKYGKESYTINPEAHEEALPKYVHRTSESSNYHIEKNYSINGKRFRFIIPGFKTWQEAQENIRVLESINRTFEKVADHAREMNETINNLEKERDELKRAPVRSDVAEELERLMKENAELRYELDLQHQKEKLNEILGGK